jgi:hypothetical protein
MYYEHQYGRIENLEQQALNTTNITNALFIAMLTFSQRDVTSHFYLPFAMVVINIFAIAYIYRSGKAIMIHQSRAKKILETHEKEIFELDKTIPIPERHFLPGRLMIQMGVHSVLLLISLSLMF